MNSINSGSTTLQMLESARSKRQIFLLEGGVSVIVVNGSSLPVSIPMYILVRTDNFVRWTNPADAILALLKAGYTWSEKEKSFVNRNGLLPLTFEEVYVNPNSIRKVFVGLPQSNIFKEARDKREENSAISKIQSILSGADTAAAYQKPVAKTLARKDGRGSDGRFTRDSVGVRGKNGRFLGKRIVSSFEYINQKGERSLRHVIINNKISTANVIKGYDLAPNKGYRTFLSSRVIGNMSHAKVYVDFSDKKNPLIVPVQFPKNS